MPETDSEGGRALPQSRRSDGRAVDGHVPEGVAVLRGPLDALEADVAARAAQPGQVVDAVAVRAGHVKGGPRRLVVRHVDAVALAEGALPVRAYAVDVVPRAQVHLEPLVVAEPPGPRRGATRLVRPNKISSGRRR